MMKRKGQKKRSFSTKRRCGRGRRSAQRSVVITHIMYWQEVEGSRRDQEGAHSGLDCHEDS